MDFFNELKDSRTIEKCQKILNLFEELEPRTLCAKPLNTNDFMSKYKYRVPTSKPPTRKSSFVQPSRKDTTPLKRISRDRGNYSSHSKIKTKNNTGSRSSLFQGTNNKSLNRSTSLSAYKKQSRLDKIMRLKVKPTYQKQKKENTESKRQAMSSYMSNDSPISNKQNQNRQPKSRLDQIMKLKVSKPNVNSTLINYDPPRLNTSFSSKKNLSRNKHNPLVQLRQCKKKLRKNEKQQEKQDRLWKVFQRERQIRCKQQKKQEEKENKDRRRKEKKFQSMVDKQLHKIQSEKEVQRRKNEGFAAYAYPPY